MGGRAQGSMEYLFMIAVTLVIALVVVSYLSRSVENIPDSQVTAPWLDPESMTSFNTSDMYFNYSVWVEPAGTGIYRVVYRLTAKETLNNVRVQATLKCERQPRYIDTRYLSVIEHYDTIPRGWYVSNYWTPLEPGDFPCGVEFNVWVG